MRPDRKVFILGNITKERPFKLPEGYRAAKFHLLVIHPDDLPVASPGATLDRDFLPHLERIGTKECYLMHKPSRAASGLLAVQV